MKSLLTLLPLVCLSCVIGCSSYQSDETTFCEQNIIGTWHANTQGIDEVTTYRENGQFDFILTFDNGYTWTGSGKWNIQGDQLFFEYEKSSDYNLAKPGHKDRDQILVLSENKMVLCTDDNIQIVYGKLNTNQRMDFTW